MASQAAAGRNVIASADGSRATALTAVPVLPLVFLRREGLDDALALHARKEERQPAERRMAELDQAAARELVQRGAVARRVQEARLLELRRLFGHRGRHLGADLA